MPHAPSGAQGEPPARCDIAIVGGGIIGLALARELARRHARARVCVLERERELASHQSAHNSGVIHAGIYYAAGSLKARLCVQGAHELYRYCEQEGIAHRRTGKLIIATHEHQLPGLRELARRGGANGVGGLAMLDALAMRRVEPHARGVEALHSPDTGVVDFRAVALAFARDAQAAGAVVATGCEVTGVRHASRSLRIEHARGALQAGHAVFCAGAWSDRLARAAGAAADPRIVPFRGSYLRLSPRDGALVRSLIYPVPDPRLPFLGVHLSRHLDGTVTVGPTALIAGARDAYRLGHVRAADVRDTLTWPGTWRLAARTWRAGAVELAHALAPRSLVREAARFVPELTGAGTRAHLAGVRAQALSRRGALIDDFAFSATGRALHVRNAPSPAATSSLAIARELADRAEAMLAR